MKRKECSLKSQFKEWLEKEQENDEMIEIATVPQILKRFDKRLVIIKGNQLEKRYLREWRETFRIDREVAKGFFDASLTLL